MSDSQRHALWPTQQYAARLQLRVHVQVGNVVTKVLGVNLIYAVQVLGVRQVLEYQKAAWLEHQ
eukprot:CAMPEP_0202400602 /NCGR_PEP_ID=MMETSP1128-20130828/2866_1 /ASSEMBLY_ACC=CAM_ASM_000463 /TAXON_ID=3047 /ORGANISM="Dunaliella tertiolecta, Strain CCMP1320" /LENGTH=63 /DNA_ID=CAMNT_0049004209 /DNA_START=56 /DNA_END=247 /DNA_ORIENTATION=-